MFPAFLIIYLNNMVKLALNPMPDFTPAYAASEQNC